MGGRLLGRPPLTLGDNMANTRLKKSEEQGDAPASTEAAEPSPSKKEQLYEGYNGPESLEGKEFEPKLDSKGKVLAPGKPKYFINRNGDTYKVIAVYRNGKGIARRLVRTLKPKKRSALDDRAIMRQLYAWKIPGAEKI